MSLRDHGRASDAFGVDPSVQRILAAWAKERDSEIGRLNLARAAARLRVDQKEQLVARLAEISLGVLFTLDRGSDSGRGG